MKRRRHRPRKREVRNSEQAAASASIRFEDEHIVVVDKPAGITTVRHAKERAAFGKRAQRYLPPTLTDQLQTILDKRRSGRRQRIRAVHRLDKDASGLLIFALTDEAESKLGKQMRAREVFRKYVALVRGHAKTERIESFLVEDRGDGRRGSSNDARQGKKAITHVQVLEHIGDYSLVECRLETGRTHQIRIHLGERGTPLCGERIYDRPLHGKPVADDSGAERVMLHASYLELTHPSAGKRLFWKSPLPEDMNHSLKRIRTRRAN